MRFAISPVDDIDISHLRVAIFNYILSKQKNESLLIRIDDVEKDKIIEGKDKEILEILNLFSIEFDRVFYESEGLKYHQKLAMQLMNQKKAFACFCSDEKLTQLKQTAEKKGKLYSYDDFCSTLSDETVLNCNAPFTVRIKRPNENILFNDNIKGSFEYKPFEIDSFIILDQDKSATYNYACAIDDMLYDISTVVRDEKYLLDTARQIYLRDSLNYDKKISYYHIPKLNNNIKIKTLIDEGFLPSAVANYLVLLGNNPKNEIFTLEEAIKWFKIEDVSKEELTFDMEKLKEINKKHLESIENLRLSKILGFADEDIGKLAKLFLNEVSTIKEIKSKIELIFQKKDDFKKFEDEFLLIKEGLSKAPFFDKFNELEEYLIEKTKINKNLLDKPLRYILTGSINGPELSKIYALTKNYLGEIVK